MKNIIALFTIASFGLLLTTTDAQISNAPTEILYVANVGNGLIRGFTIAGSDLGNITTTPVPQAVGIGLDSSKNIYVVSVSDNYIRRFSPSGADLGIFANTGLNSGRALIFDSVGNLYVDNVGNNTVRRFSPTGVDLGNFISNGLSNPTAMAFDEAGNLYVANYSLNQVKKFGPDGTLLGVAISAGLNQPAGLAIIPQAQGGGFYVANDFAGTLIRYDTNGTIVSTLVNGGLGRLAFIALDSTGNVYVTRLSNNAVRKFSPNGQDLGDLAVTGLSTPQGIFIGRSAAFDSVTRGLVAHYPFNGNANDESGNGNNGTVHDATLTMNRFGTPDSAYHFSNAFIIATNIPINLAGPYTYSAWIGLNEFQDGRALFELSLDSTNCNGNPQMYQTASSVFYSPCGNGQTGLNFFGTEGDLINQWRHFTVTVNNGLTKIYRDGVLLSSTSETWPTTDAIMLTLGAARGGLNPFGIQFSLCALDDVRIYNRALSSNEVAQLHALESQPSCEDTVSILQGQVAGLQTQLAGTNNIVSTLRAQVAGLQSDLAATNELVSTLQTQVSNLQTQLATANSLVSTLQTQVVGLQTQLSTSNARVQTLETELTAVNVPVQRLTRDFQVTFKSPQFQIPGSTISAKVNNIVLSIEKLSKGSQQTIYNNLGGGK